MPISFENVFVHMPASTNSVFNQRQTTSTRSGGGASPGCAKPSRRPGVVSWGSFYIIPWMSRPSQRTISPFSGVDVEGNKRAVCSLRNNPTYGRPIGRYIWQCCRDVISDRATASGVLAEWALGTFVLLHIDSRKGIGGSLVRGRHPGDDLERAPGDVPGAARLV